MSHPAQLENRLGQVEKELRRRGLETEVRTPLDAERAHELAAAATDAELDALEGALRRGDGLERARLVAALERRAEGLDGEAGGGDAASALRAAVLAERERRAAAARESFARLADAFDWMTAPELEQMSAAVRRGRDLGDGRTEVSAPAARMIGRLVERARRRARLGLEVRGRLVAGRWWLGGACRRGGDACRCLAGALDLPGWERLGLGGIRAVAKHRHEAVRVRRASGAARRRRARERRALAAPVPAPGAARVGAGQVLEVVREPRGARAIGAAPPMGGAVGAPVDGSQSRRRRRSARLYLASLPLTDREAAELSARLALPPPGPVRDGRR